MKGGHAQATSLRGHSLPRRILLVSASLEQQPHWPERISDLRLRQDVATPRRENPSLNELFLILRSLGVTTDPEAASLYRGFGAAGTAQDLRPPAPRREDATSLKWENMV